MSPLAAVEDAKDLQFDSEVEAIRSAAVTAAAASATVTVSDGDDSDGSSGQGEGGVADAAKELVAA